VAYTPVFTESFLDPHFTRIMQLALPGRTYSFNLEGRGAPNLTDP
jgi:hypothetical protein